MAVPIANSLTFALTALTGRLLGEEFGSQSTPFNLSLKSNVPWIISFLLLVNIRNGVRNASDYHGCPALHHLQVIHSLQGKRDTLDIPPLSTSCSLWK